MGLCSGENIYCFSVLLLSPSVTFHNFFTLLEVRIKREPLSPFSFFIKSNSKNTLHVYEEKFINIKNSVSKNTQGVFLTTYSQENKYLNRSVLLFKA